MGLTSLLRSLIGSPGSISEVAEVFRPNAEAEAARRAESRSASLDQLAAEFARAPRGPFDSFVDGLNRLPRPLMALGVIGLFISAMSAPLWFGERMAGLAMVPEPMWYLLGAIVAFYFGARHQVKGQEFQKSVAASLAMAPKVTGAIRELRKISAMTPGVADTSKDDAETQLAALDIEASDNPALDDWRRMA